MGSREKSENNNREKIIETASRLIIEKGVSNTSLADISREMNISKGTLYYYYPSKGDLIFDISERHMQHMTEKIFRWLNKSEKELGPAEILKMIFQAVISSGSRGHIHVYLIQEAATGNESLKKRFREEYNKWRGLIEDGLKKVVPERDDIDVLARIILSTMDGLFLQSLLGISSNPLREISRFLIRED